MNNQQMLQQFLFLLVEAPVIVSPGQIGRADS